MFWLFRKVLVSSLKFLLLFSQPVGWGHTRYPGNRENGGVSEFWPCVSTLSFMIWQTEMCNRDICRSRCSDTGCCWRVLCPSHLTCCKLFVSCVSLPLLLCKGSETKLLYSTSFSGHFKPTLPSEKRFSLGKKNYGETCPYSDKLGVVGISLSLSYYSASLSNPLQHPELSF